MIMKPAALVMTTLGVACCCAAAGGEPNRWGYDFDDAYDAVRAAPDVHRLKYEDAHVQFLEVANPPGYRMQMHGHPYPSVFARSSVGDVVNQLAARERFLDPASPKNGQSWRTARAPDGLKFPTCTAADPQAPHVPFNGTDTPLHFHRLEFKQIDQDDPTSMRQRYGQQPLLQVRYEDAAIRLVEITLQPGQTAAAEASTPPAVLAFDTTAAFDAVSEQSAAAAGRSAPPAGMILPRCMTMAAGQMPALVNRLGQPLHFYRIEFKRMDTPGLREHWREWYPFMVEMQATSP
jgi:hypothetical protein